MKFCKKILVIIEVDTIIQEILKATTKTRIIDDTNLWSGLVDLMAESLDSVDMKVGSWVWNF